MIFFFGKVETRRGNSTIERVARREASKNEKETKEIKRRETRLWVVTDKIYKKKSLAHRFPLLFFLVSST